MRAWKRGVAVLGAALAVAALAGEARAQSRDGDFEKDSLGIPADTVRLRPRRVPVLKDCDVIGNRVVDSDSAAAALRRYPQCADARFGSLSERTLVQLALFGDCHAGYRVDAWRSESRREYRLRVTEYYGGCRSARFPHIWLALPKLPAGWTIRLTEEQGERRGRPLEDPVHVLSSITVAAELPPEPAGT